MKAWVDCDEWFPVYIISTNDKQELIEIPDDLCQRWFDLEKQMDEIQDELQKYYKPRVWK